MMFMKRFISCLFVLTLLTGTGGAGNSFAETIYFTETFDDLASFARAEIAACEAGGRP